MQEAVDDCEALGMSTCKLNWKEVYVKRSLLDVVPEDILPEEDLAPANCVPNNNSALEMVTRNLCDLDKEVEAGMEDEIEQVSQELLEFKDLSLRSFDLQEEEDINPDSPYCKLIVNNRSIKVLKRTLIWLFDTLFYRKLLQNFSLIIPRKERNVLMWYT